ncbi:MAG: type II toxin-antitoxin system RelE/ParE family toxin [Candidatus Micrarchaeota archaeon]
MNEEWQIEFSNSAQDFIRKLKLKDNVERILRKISELKNGPFSIQYKSIVGLKHTYRIRVGDYRITYEADFISKIINILEVGTRENIYD